ncbi:MAG: hypothetical protein IKY39_00895, partial [Clostridia bacterium]|nr:hypothetical protein [Clostridia bacterium]
MKIKKLIAGVCAIAMLMTSVISVNAYTFAQSNYYEFPFTVLADDMQPGEYIIDSAKGIKWVYEQGSDANGKKGRCAIKTDHAATGTNSLYVMGNDVDGGNSIGAKMSIHFGKLTGDGTYTIQFDASHWSDYAE